MKNIPDFSNYLACEDGRLFNKKKNRFLRQSFKKSNRGYTSAFLIRDDGVGRCVPVHPLICSAFHGKRPEGMQCRHLNGKRSDNRAENLRWGTAQENVDDSIRHGTIQRGESHYSSKLNWEKVCFIRENYKAYDKEFGGKALAKKFGIRRNMIERILNNKLWKHKQSNAGH